MSLLRPENFDEIVGQERAVRSLISKMSSPYPQHIILYGPPGVGKTSFGMNVAKSLHKEFYKISVGGLNDTNELMGNRRTYIGSSPGKIMQALLKCGVNNPVILIDKKNL